MSGLHCPLAEKMALVGDSEPGLRKSRSVLFQALVCTWNQARVSSSLKCSLCTHPALSPACQVAPSHTQLTLSPPWRALGEEGERVNGIKMSLKGKGALWEWGNGSV